MNNYTNTYVNDKSSFLTRVFTYLAVGLGLGALGAFAGVLLLNIMGSTFVILMLALMVAELVLVVVMSRNLDTRSLSSVRGMFIAYSFINGMTLSTLLLAYTSTSVVFAFLTTAVVFASLAIIGKTTKIDLTKFGSLLMVGLIVCLVMTIINALFIRSGSMDIVMCYVETFIFMGLIAYDTQMIDRYYGQTNNENFAIYAALQLELDFVNLFIRILQIFGRRRND